MISARKMNLITMFKNLTHFHFDLNYFENIQQQKNNINKITFRIDHELNFEIDFLK